MALAAAIAVVYVAVAPASQDLAAQAYRAGLFDREGWALWDNAWYGGHPLPGYSVLFPPLGALLGVRVAGALSVVVAAALFAALVRDLPGARLGAAWFGAGVAAQLFTGRMAFLLGVAVGLGALLAAQRGRRAPAIGLAAATTLASPVAGAFLALAGVAWRSRPGFALAAAAVVPGLALAVFFPEGGTEPFVPSAFWPALVALTALALLLPAEQRTLRAGAALAALACVFAFAVPSPLGGNVTRLGALFAGPLVACVALDGRRRALALAAVPLLAYWQLMPPVRDTAILADDPSAQAAYHAPLIAEIERRGGGKVEIPFTRAHWEAKHVAEHLPLARGWQRQLDRDRNALFYEGTLTARELRAWLDENAVRWVAVAGVELDPSSRDEARLVRAGAVRGLREVWRNGDWRLFAVRDARPLGASALATDAFAATRSGVVRVRWSPYWAVTAGKGCIERAPGDWTAISIQGRGPVRIAQRFSFARGLGKSSDARCEG